MIYEQNYLIFFNTKIIKYNLFFIYKIKNEKGLIIK